MVSRLLRAVSAGTGSELARTDVRHQARSSRRELEIALQQSADDGAQLKCARFLLQRSRLPDRLRMRLEELRIANCGLRISQRKAITELCYPCQNADSAVVVWP